MKSCPTCDRTFDDTMTFCLVDGSILSAPFDPVSGDRNPARRNSEPPPTQMVDPAAISARSDRESPEASPPTHAVPNAFAKEADRTTIGSSLRAQPESARDQPALKTIQAPPPEVVFNKQSIGAVSAEAKPDWQIGETTSKRPSRLIVLGIVVVFLIGLAVGVTWLITRGKKSAGAVQKPQATATNTRTAPSGDLFKESVNGTEIEMLSIPSGTFLMGSPTSESGRDPDEGPQSNVTVQNFFLGKYEVTQGQYRAVTGANPSAFKGDNLPVDSVTWSDAVEFCRKLSTLTGRHYRLPTEAEWEYAARERATDQVASNVNLMAWYGGNSGGQTHPVGQKEANHFGLYDMYGNVWEWCQSKYKPYPYSSNDGREDLQPGEVRVLRGGSWESAAKACRASYRRRVIPKPNSAGFRIVLASD